MLEKAVTEAQTSESRVSNLQLWIYQVDRMLNEFYENDTTIEDLPHDFQVRCMIFVFRSEFQAWKLYGLHAYNFRGREFPNL